MTVNFAPIFPISPKVSWATLATANTAKDGTGTVSTLLTAGVNGTRVDSIKVRALGTNVATVIRIFINNGATNTVATNNILFTEYTIATTTVSEVSAQVDTVITMNCSLPPSYTIFATIGTTVSAGLAVTALYGDY